MLLRKVKTMVTRRNSTSNSDLRDRVIFLERELKKTQDRIQKDIKNLYEIINKKSGGTNQ